MADLRFLADIRDGIFPRGRESADSKGREKPCRVWEEVVRSNGMKDAVRARPRPGWRSSGGVEDFAACSGRKAGVHTTGIAGDAFKRGGAWYVVSGSDAAVCSVR